MSVEKEMVVTQADRDAAEAFGNAWRMNSTQKFGLSNLLAKHRIAALDAAIDAALATYRGDRK